MLLTPTTFLVLVGLVGHNNGRARAVQHPPSVYYFPPSKGKEVPRYPEPLAPRCDDALQEEDYEKPITTAIRDHGGVDGFCLFAPMGDWAKNCYRAHWKYDYMVYARLMETTYIEKAMKDSRVYPDSPLTVFYEKGTKMLRTHLRDGAFNDVYCEANGWTNLPKDQVGNHTYMDALAKQECDKILANHPEYKNTSMHDFIQLATHETDAVHTPAGPSIKDARHHAAVMCLLGGLGCDMVNCAVNFCKIDKQGLYGHGEKMCGYVKDIRPELPALD